MHHNAIPGRMKADLDRVDNRLNARLDRIETMMERLMRAAGLEVPPPLPPATEEPPTAETLNQAR